MLLRFQPEDLGADMLHGPQQFAVALSQHVCIGAADLDIDQTVFQSVGVSRACTCGDAKAQLQAAGRGECLEKIGRLLGGGLQVLHG